jgi:hypothetical protein
MLKGWFSVSGVGYRVKKTLYNMKVGDDLQHWCIFGVVENNSEGEKTNKMCLQRKLMKRNTL